MPRFSHPLVLLEQRQVLLFSLEELAALVSALGLVKSLWQVLVEEQAASLLRVAASLQVVQLVLLQDL